MRDEEGADPGPGAAEQAGKRRGAEAGSAVAAEPEGKAEGGRRSRFGGGATGFYFYGVVRSRGLRARGGEQEQLLRVRYRDLDALVRPIPFRVPALDTVHVQAHQRTVESVMRRATILPAPYGVVFRGRRPLVRFLEDQYLVLDEALAFLEGHWELRLHLSPIAPGDPAPELDDLAAHIYAELRRFARAAIPFPREGRRILSAAFLVDRASWIEFVNRSDDMSGAHAELGFDVTGPWPPYDFVRMTV